MITTHAIEDWLGRAENRRYCGRVEEEDAHWQFASAFIFIRPREKSGPHTELAIAKLSLAKADRVSEEHQSSSHDAAEQGCSRSRRLDDQRHAVVDRCAEGSPAH
jgi:hypothetical protein